jgi:HlyD family secretion protein
MDLAIGKGAMDIPRTPQTTPRRRRLIYGAIGVVVLALVTIGLGRLQAEPRAVARDTLFFGAVQRGLLVRDITANGALVPEHMQWVTALSAGRVERIHVRPGTAVQTDTILLEISNPDLELQALEAERQVSAAEAAHANLRASLQNERLAQEAAVATIKTDLGNAQRKAEADRELGQGGYVARLEEGTSSSQATLLADRLALEDKRLATMTRGLEARLAAEKAQIERMRTIARFRHEQLEAMKIRAGADGVLQELPLEAGQWVTPGQLVAKVARPERLKALLRVPETLAKDLAIGQRAEIDTHNGVIAGRVVRIDPASQGGTVAVDVALDGELPKGARPDLSVIGNIELERVPDALFVDRPAFSQPDATIGVWKVAGDQAVRVKVAFGRASTRHIEVVSGLAPGDRIIVSDMSSYDSLDRIRIE